MAKKKKLKRKAQSHPTNSLATSPSPYSGRAEEDPPRGTEHQPWTSTEGETREELRQINVSCLTSIGEQFTDLSLKTGRTKRALLEEAITHLIRKYA
jgi:hypothetical protein